MGRRRLFVADGWHDGLGDIGMAPNEAAKWGSKRPPLIKIESGKITPEDPGVINMPYIVKFKKSEG